MVKKFKPQIFIGSSKESKEIAEQIQDELSSVADCKIWYKQFDLGNSAYEDLVNKLALYDYGLLVASGDDATTSKGIRHLSIRDNVLFEFGLFAGRFGRQRSFLFAEKGVKIPTDLNGITLPFFESDRKCGLFCSKKKRLMILDAHKKSVSKSCEKIRDHIKSRQNIFDYGFLPSTSLAYGYFNNFVVRAVSQLMDLKEFKIVGGDVAITFEDIKFKIFIPDDLTSDMFDRVKNSKSLKKWELVKIDAGAHRPFDFHIEMETTNKGIVHLADFPLTLNSLTDSIRSYIGKSYIGVSEAENLLEMRELRIFKGVLDFLISSNPLTRNRVETEVVDI